MSDYDTLYRKWAKAENECVGLRDQLAALRHENTLLIEWGRRILARAESMPGGQYPTSAEVRKEAGLPID